MGEALNRLNSLSDEEIIALSPEQFSRLKKDVQREANVDDRLGGQDNLLGIGPDLNRPLRALQPVDVPAQGNEDFGGVFSTGTATDEDVERTFSRYDAKKSNAMRNLASLPLEFLKVINSPLDTAEHLGSVLMGGFKKAKGPAISHLSVPEDDPDVSTANQFADAMVGQFSKEERERRPVDPVLTAMSAIAPALRATSLVKTPASLKALRQIEDPGAEAVRVGGKATLRALSRVKDEVSRRRPRPLKALLDKEVGDSTVRDYGKQVAGTVGRTVLSFTTNTSNRIQKIIATAPERGTSRIIKSFSGPVLEGEEILDTGKLSLQDKLVRETLGAVDKIKETSDEFQQQSQRALAPHMATGVTEGSMERLKKGAALNFKEFNGIIANEFATEQLAPDIDQIPSQRATTPSAMFEDAADELRAEFPEGTKFKGDDAKSFEARGRTGEAELGFESFPSKRASEITSEGRSRGIVEAFHQRLINAPPTTVGSLQRLMWEIDDAINITDTEIGRKANRSLVQLRQRIRKTLSDELGEPYNEATAQYERDMTALNDIKTELGIEPGQISETGNLRNVDRSKVLHNIIVSLDDADEFAYEALLNLERASGKPITDMAAGVATQSTLGSGLVAKSEISQAGRGPIKNITSIPRVLQAGGVGAAAGIALGTPIVAVAGLAAAVLFSPKIMQRIVLGVQDPVLRAQAKTWAKDLRGRMENASRRGVRVSEWIKEGATIEQVIQRLEQVPIEQEQILSPEGEAEFGGASGDDASPKNNTFMETIGNIDTTPAAR